jgi:DNA-directed RNA polymerase subunit RPC12/RpoP
MQTTRRQFLGSAGLAVAGGTALALGLGGCAALVSPTVTAEKSQAWRCEDCGHLTRSDKDLSASRCPRCHRKGVFTKISEAELQTFLKKS